MDTTGPRKCVEVSLFQKLIALYIPLHGTSETRGVLISEVSFMRGSTVDHLPLLQIMMSLEGKVDTN